MVLLLILIAAAGGAAIAIQSQFMGVMDRGIGTIESVFITYGGGGLLITLFVLLRGPGKLEYFLQVPWYNLTSGAIGLVIVGAIGFVVPRLGLSASLTITIAAQLAIAALIDHFGLIGADVRPIGSLRILGFVVMFFGVWLITRTPVR